MSDAPRVRVLTRGEARTEDLQRALDELEIGPGDQFVICKQATLLDGREARARRGDPSTSHAAAETLTEDKLRANQEAVLRVLRDFGPMIDEQLIAAYQTNAYTLPAQSESGIRTRRRELADAGLVIDTGEKRDNDAGNKSIVWKAPPPIPADGVLDYTGGDGA